MPAGFLLATILGTVCLAIASVIYLLVSVSCGPLLGILALAALPAGAGVCGGPVAAARSAHRGQGGPLPAPASALQGGDEEAEAQRGPQQAQITHWPSLAGVHSFFPSFTVPSAPTWGHVCTSKELRGPHTTQVSPDAGTVIPW